MKILHIELGRHLYGGAKQVVYLINALNQLHNAPCQNLVCAEGSDIASVPLANCTTYAIPYSGELDVGILWRVERILLNVKPDILHIHSRRGADLWGALIARNSKIPAICTRRVDNPEHSLNRFKYSQYRAVVSISKGVQKVVTQLIPSQVKQAIIYSSVDLTEYHFEADPDWFKQHFVIPNNHKVIANFAQLIPRKGQRDLIKAMKNVLERFPNTVCLLFGQGKEHAHYQELIEAANIADNVRLCGFTKEVPRILPNIDVVVHPAHAEGLGVILLQAGACKRPVIACPSGGIPEIIHHGKTGWLVPKGEPLALENAIFDALSNPSEAKTRGEALYQHTCDKFSTESMAQAYLGLYTQLLVDKSRITAG